MELQEIPSRSTDEAEGAGAALVEVKTQSERDIYCWNFCKYSKTIIMFDSVYAFVTC